MAKGPILFDVDDTEAPVSPATEPPVPDPTGEAMQSVAKIVTRQPSRLARWFWGTLIALIGALVSIAFWDFVTGLMARSSILAGVIAALVAVLFILSLVFILRELAALSRLNRVDALRQDAEAVTDLATARRVCDRVHSFLASRANTQWGRDRFTERREDAFDADALMDLAERTMLEPLDRAAQSEVEAAARQVATVTALVPLAMADVVAALVANIRMIRRIAEIYGGRSGFFSSWRLIRAVVTHLAVTGAVAAGDEVLDHVLGGSVLSKLSRRFGEGLVNGALTARVGRTAMELCRPLPFGPDRRPAVRGIVTNALRGIVSFNKER